MTRAQLDHAVSLPLFSRSLNPMLIADDEGRFVDANAAACLFLRLPAEEVCKLTLEDLTPPRRRPRLEAMWSSFLRGDRTGDLEYGRTLPWNLQMPDGTSVQVEISGTPRFRPGRHLLVIVFPAARALNERIGSARPPATEILTRREREILTLVALGHTGVQVAARLYLSPATVATHVTNALIKLGAKNRAHGIALALQAQELDAFDASEVAAPFTGFQTSTRDAAENV